VQARRRAEEYAEAFNAACIEAWDQRLAAKRMLLDAAECALNKAEARRETSAAGICRYSNF
jgi:hypothetical protein